MPLLGLLAAAAFPPRGLRAQTPLVREASLGAVTFLAHRTFVGAEGGLAHRVGQGRVGLIAAAGVAGDAPAARLEARAQFLLLPPGRSAAGMYGGLGLAAAEAAGRHGALYLTVALGVETSVWRAAGLYAELGLGGGVRLGAGVRWRQVPAWWP